MHQIAVALTIIGATVLVVGLFSEILKRTLLQEPLIAVAVGLATGPYGVGWLDVPAWPYQLRMIEQLAELTLAISLVATALRINAEHLHRLWKPVLVLLTAGMAGMWGLSSLSAAWALNLPLAVAALLGAAVTPTDPVVASSIVTGRFAQRHLPERIRASMSMESGANDGLAYLFIMLAIVLLVHEEPLWGQWLVTTVLHGVVLAVVAGAAIGYGAGRLLHWAHHGGLIETYSLLTFTVTLSLFTLGAATLLGTTGLIAVFVAGLVFSLTTDVGERHEEERVQEGMNKLFTLPMFVVFGAALPIEAWAADGGRVLAFALAVLVLRRMPVFALLFPALRGAYSRRDAAYLGWFGPVGVAAIYYAVFSVSHTDRIVIWENASAVIFASILAHGVTAAPLSRRYSGLN